MTRSPGPYLRAAAVAFAVLGGARPAPAAAQARGPEIEDVRFTGNQAVDEDRLRSAIRTRESNCRLILRPLCWFGVGVERHYLSGDVVRADELRLRLLYFERGYRDAEVASSVAERPDGVVVTFRIDEGRPVRVASIAFGADAPDVPSATSPPLPLAVGLPLDLILLQGTRDTVQTRLRNTGYAHAQVLSSYLIPTDSPYSARVTYDVYPGATARFGEIAVEGAHSVSPSVVRRMLDFQEGDLYRHESILVSQRSLYGFDLFTHASVEPDLDTADPTVVPVLVRVNEGDIHRVRVGAGINSYDCANAEGRWTSRSFMGGARRLEIRGRVANMLAESLSEFPCVDAGTGEIFGRLNGSLTADFVQPFFLGTRNALGAGLSLERRSVPGVFVRDTRGAYVSISRRVGDRESITLGYRPALTDFVAGGDPFFCVSFLACDRQSIEVLRTPHWLAPFTASFVHDGANSAFAPNHGSVLRLDGEFASGFTGSDFPYVRLSGEAAVYGDLGNDVVFAAHVRPGWARAIEAVAGDRDLGLHPQRRFFAGGPNSVRGFAYYRLGPKILVLNGTQLANTDPNETSYCTGVEVNKGTCDASAVPDRRFDPRPTGGTLLMEGNVELRFPLLGDRLSGVTFLDVGQVWNDRAEAVKFGDLAWTPGIGVRYFSPIGPIRVDVGYNGEGAEVLDVKTTEVAVCRKDTPLPLCVDPAEGAVYDPSRFEYRNTNRLQDLGAVEWNPRRSFIDRLQLQFSIGQAF